MIFCASFGYGCSILCNYAKKREKNRNYDKTDIIVLTIKEPNAILKSDSMTAVSEYSSENVNENKW